jgi:hypothetical protein
MRPIHHKSFSNSQAGFSVLFAALIGGLLLSVGVAILSITLKQITLASAGRESQKAFYAADTGTECALYLDRGGGNSNCNGSGIFPIPGKSAAICDEGSFVYMCSDVKLSGVDSQADSLESTTLAPETDVSGDVYQRIQTTVRVRNTSQTGEPICFDVFVTKKSNDGGATVKTEIESRGYSVCNERAGNRFERAILTTY